MYRGEELSKGRLRAIRALRTKRGRERQGRTIIEGVRLVEAALEAGARPEVALYTPRILRSERGNRLLEALQRSGSRIHAVSEEVMAGASATETPQGILAVIPSPGVPLEQVVSPERLFLLAVDGVQDPGNLGTMLRTAAAAGATGALLGRGTVDAGNPKTVRAAMGATFLLPLAAEVDLPPVLLSLARRGVAVIAGDPAGETPLFGAPVAPPVVVVVGGEANGLSPAVEAVVTQRLRIPMASGVESLNAAVAAALLLYEVNRRQTQPLPCQASERRVIITPTIE
ncbi:MAG: RNA methyltransferase [Bacillota bacterium]|nr:RNA methyltransferase [Bacillota bacterium]